MGYITFFMEKPQEYMRPFQSSFELMGYITIIIINNDTVVEVSKLFRAYGLYNIKVLCLTNRLYTVSKLFRAYGLYNIKSYLIFDLIIPGGFKALSSLWVI